jgi:predicted nucleotidyltransferase
METKHLPQHLKELLSILNECRVEYLLIGGYAVGYYGYPRATDDADIWVAISTSNADKIIKALVEFGFNESSLHKELFVKENQIARMGRVEILTSISGVEFEECYKERKIDMIDGIEVSIISLPHLKVNKKASGRTKDINDLEHLP